MPKLLACRNVLGVALLLVGCSSDGLLDPSETYDGWFQMERVDDRPLPLVTGNEGDCQVINLGGWIELKRDGSFRMEFDRTATICGGITQGWGSYIMRGTYTISGEQIRFEGDRDEGTLTGVYRSHMEIDGTTTRAGTIEFNLGSRSYLFVDIKSSPLFLNRGDTLKRLSVSDQHSISH